MHVEEKDTHLFREGHSHLHLSWVKDDRAGLTLGRHKGITEMTMLLNCTVGKVVEGANTSAESCADHSKNSLKLLPLSLERAAGSSQTCSGALAVSGLVCPTSV